MRLIDADKIKLPQGFFEKIDNVPKFYEWLDKQPTVDAVKVVRCKDCVYYEQLNNNEYYCDAIYRNLHGDDEGVTFEPPEDYFCAYGKRREEK